MKKEEKIFKVNATIDDDINLIIDSIEKVKANDVVLALPEGNDLLNSPVGLKTLKRKALNMGKAVIVLAPTKQYQQLVTDSGLVAVLSQENLTPEVWANLHHELEDYKNTKVGLNSRAQERKPQPPRKSPDVSTEPPIHTSSNVIDADSGVEKPANAGSMIIPPAPPEESTPSFVTAEGQQHSQSGYIERAQRQDKFPVTQIKNQGNGLVGMDFSKVVNKHPNSIGDMLGSWFGIKKQSSVPKVKDEDAGLPIITKPLPSSMQSPKPSNPALRVAGVILLGLLIFFGGLFAVYYIYFPKIRIELKVLSDKVEITDKVTATTAVTGFDSTKKEFQLKKEDAQQRGSVNITATGQGVEGTKATGQVTIGNNPGPKATVPAGTVLVSPSGLKFVTQADVEVKTAPLNGTVAVSAADYGEEYNLAAATTFSVTGYPSFSGTNSAAFTGGTKRTYTVLSKKDVDDAVDQLKKDLFDQLKSDLKFRNENSGYVFIDESFTADLDGQPVVNPAIGTETQQAFMELKTKASAYYYQKDSFQKLIENFIAAAYRKNKNVDANADLMIEGTNVAIQKVTVSKDDKVDFDIKATGLVTPRINTDQLKKDIMGKKWPDMLSRVSAINTLAATPTIHFFPSWMPDILKYVPAEESRIDISVTVVQQ